MTLARSRRVCGGAVLVVFSLLITACGGGGTGGATQTAAASAKPSGAAAPAACQTVNLFGIQALTGSNASPGIQTQTGSEVAVKQINDAGGFKDSAGNCYTLTLDRHDMGNDRDQAVSLFRQAAADPKYLASIGPAASTGFVPIEAIAGDLKMLVISNGSLAAIAKWNEWSYRANPLASVQLPAALKIIKEKINFKTIATIHDQTNDGQVASAALVKSLASTLGYQVVASPVFSPSDQDFSAQISQIKAAKPDLVAILSTAVAGSKVALQMSQGGLTAPLLSTEGGGVDPVYWDNSQGTIKGSYTYLAADLKAASGGVKTFLDLYTAANPNLAPTTYPILGYDTIHVIVAAIKKANSADRQKVQQAMTNLETVTPLGTKITYKNPPNGDTLTTTVITVQVTGRGTYTVLQ